MYSTLDIKYMMSDYHLIEEEKGARRNTPEEIEEIRNFWNVIQKVDKTEEAREDIDRHYERESRIVESQLHNQYA